ncbi:MAG TPA: transketolase C-terminal domain-containing protein [Candidatus Omnitrophota bacterium]|nr:transketolase C-terminal domain-containing protein [Candidatus Omnitrophota bacterium]
MRKTCLDMVYQLAKQDERIFFIGSDPGVDTLKQFKKEMPERFIIEGVSEANLVSVAAGLALEGKIVYANTIATFLSRRCFEQIVLDAGLHKTNVRLIANGGGLVYAPLGPTHLAIDDLAILRAVPNMTIVAVADADEMRRLMPQTVDYPGPIYIRLAKGFDPIVTNDDAPFQIGKAIVRGQGRDALIITTGITLRLALEAVGNLKEDGLDATILHMHTVKPFDREALLKHAKDIPIIISVEEHNVIGGLGSAVAEAIAEANFEQPKKFKRIGIQDVFPDRYGSQDSLMEYLGISPEAIVQSIRHLRLSKKPIAELPEYEVFKQ